MSQCTEEDKLFTEWAEEVRSRSLGPQEVDVELDDAVSGKAAARHGWADDATPTPTESPQVHTASSISGMCEF